jgi:nucleotide-binding universal stress UspA family protein
MEVHVYQVIVVGTDGSARAGVAVREAIGLAQVTGSVLHGVHVRRPVLMSGTDADAAIAASNADRLDESERIAEEFLAEAGNGAIVAEMHTFDGDPADALIKVAEAVRADLVVIGNRGMSGVRRFVLGSVPNKVAHHCPSSVLIVDTDTV